MQFRKNHITITFIILLILGGITIYFVNKTLNSNIVTQYKGFTIDEKKSTYENLSSIPEFSLFLDSVARTRMDFLLKTEPEILTLAVVNEGFASISPEQTAKLQTPEQLHKLEKIVQLHFVRMTGVDLNKLGDLTTIGGQKIRVTSQDGTYSIRDSVGNTFKFDKSVYKTANGYFVKLDQILLPTNVSFANGVQIELDETIVENVDLFAGKEKWTDEQDAKLKSDNITYLFSEEIAEGKTIEDYILVGKYSVFQIANFTEVRSATGLTLPVTVSENEIKIGDLTVVPVLNNIESKNGFIHFVR